MLFAALNFDFASKAMDAAFTGEALANIGGLQASRDRAVTMSGKRDPTIADVVEFSRRGTG